MRFPMRVNRLSFLSALRVFACIVCGVFVIESASLSLFERMTVAAEVEEAEAPKTGAAEVPEVPDGTPEELLAFARSLREDEVPSGSRQEMTAYMKKVSATSVIAVDKALENLKPTDPLWENAAEIKMDGLMMLSQMGDPKAAETLNAFAKIVTKSPFKKLAKQADRVLLISEARNVLQGNIEKAPALIASMTKMLAADPDDIQTAQLAMQLAGAFEHVKGGETLSKKAYASFGPLLAKSSNEQVQELSKSFEGILRRLDLPGNVMKVTGMLLDGTPFDQKTLKGKVVLVDFWATWCGPCIAEIPNVLEQYEKYHDKGFEVIGISLDKDRDALEKFIAEKKIPWPILFEESAGGWQHPMATYYGISGIPTVVLIGRDGKVITLDARGENLGEQLDVIFKDAG